jgi:hypothetical protein
MPVTPAKSKMHSNMREAIVGVILPTKDVQRNCVGNRRSEWIFSHLEIKWRNCIWSTSCEWYELHGRCVKSKLWPERLANKLRLWIHSARNSFTKIFLREASSDHSNHHYSIWVQVPPSPTQLSRQDACREYPRTRQFTLAATPVWRTVPAVPMIVAVKSVNTTMRMILV